jgi:hypothetical protein
LYADQAPELDFVRFDTPHSSPVAGSIRIIWASLPAAACAPAGIGS